MTLDLERPIRNPDQGSGPLMSKRARWLVVLGFLLPGSAQVLAGNKRLGRFGLGATLFVICAGIAALAGFLFARVPTLTFFTNGIVLFVIQILLFAYAILWLVLGFDTLRLTRLVRVQPGWRVPIAVISVILTVVPALGAAWAGTTVDAGRNLLGNLFRGAPAVEPVDGRYNILLLGTDAGADREGLRPDSISLVSVDAETGQSIIVGLPRDTIDVPFAEGSPMAEMHPNGFGVAPNAFGDWGGCEVGRCILNGVYAESELFYPELYPNATANGSSPGIEATKDAVTGITGLKVQFYVLVNMDAFESMIDALGGVEIDVKETLPIGGDEYGNNVDGYIEPGLRKLNGYEAQWYARSRYGSTGGDYDRMARQRELQAAILAQMNPSNVLLRFQEVASAGTELVETDIPDSMLGRFVDLAAKAREHTPVNVELVPPSFDPEYPDFSVARNLVADGVAQASPPKEE
ncbi:LCP family protein [Leucobacter luti]|uniref:LCP family protein n=1 Tax=Leucobacter luti TaxID=340320 RepID=UPI003D04A96C